LSTGRAGAGLGRTSVALSRPVQERGRPVWDGPTTRPRYLEALAVGWPRWRPFVSVARGKKEE